MTLNELMPVVAMLFYAGANWSQLRGVQREVSRHRATVEWIATSVVRIAQHAGVELEDRPYGGEG